MKMTRKEMIDRIRLFRTTKTYTFIKDKFGYFYNGYILKQDKDKIVFRDDIIGEMPIYIKEINEITYSKRGRE